MKLKVIYDINSQPSTALLSLSAEEIGFESLGPISDIDNNVIGNIWYDVEDPSKTDFTDLQTLLSNLAENLTYEIIE